MSNEPRIISDQKNYRHMDSFPLAGRSGLRNQIKHMDEDSRAAFSHRSPSDPVYLNKSNQILNTNDADIFYTFSLTRSDVISLVFYSVFLVFLIIVDAIQLLVLKNRKVYYLFYTIHTYYLNMLWLGFSIVNIITKPQKWDCFWQVMRVLHVMVYTATLTITFAFWTVVAWSVIPKLSRNCFSAGYCLFHAIVSHGVVCLPSWIVLLATVTEVRAYDVIWPLGYLLIYLFLILWPVSVNYKQIYADLTFKDAKSFVIVLGWVLTTITVFFVGYFLTGCTKKRILSKWSEGGPNRR